jgi:small-conductance mechanosensitive channel
MEQKEKTKNFGVILRAIIIAIIVVLIGYSIIRIIKSGLVQPLII